MKHPSLFRKSLILTLLAAWLAMVFFALEFGNEAWVATMLLLNVLMLFMFMALAVVNWNGNQSMMTRFDAIASLIFNTRPMFENASPCESGALHNTGRNSLKTRGFSFKSTLNTLENDAMKMALQYPDAHRVKKQSTKDLDHSDHHLRIRMDTKGRIINVSDEVAHFHNTTKKKLKKYTKDDIHERLSLDNPNWYIQVLENHQSHASGMTRLKGETVKIFWLFKALFDYENCLKGIEAYGRRITAFFENPETSCKTQIDPLTGLKTAKGLHEFIEASAPPEKACAYFLDVDGFSTINDYYGHAFGDKVLERVSEHLKSFSGPKIIISRVSADQFVLLHMKGAESQEFLVDSMKPLSQMSLTIDGIELLLNMKIGHAKYPDHAETLEELIAKANLALKHSDFTTPYGFVSYEASFGDDLNKKMHIAQRLRTAIREDLLDIHFQKVYDVRTEEATSVEALVRWTDPIYGRVTPVEIFEIAEAAGMTIMLEKVLVVKAIEAFRALKEMEEYEDMTLALNLAPPSLLDKDFLPYLENAIHTNGLIPKDITIEISERIFMNKLEVCLERISTYKAKGFKIAIDDFGKEFSSLSVLERIDFDIIKIDALFVKNIAIKKNQEIFRMVKRITENTKQSFIVEGVETKDQKHILEALGCFYQQGFLHHYPRPLK